MRVSGIKNKIVALLLGSMVALSLQAQTSFTPINLGDRVNSEYPEINPILHPDGKTLYFSRANNPENTWGGVNSQDIWYSVLGDDGTWSQAQRLPRAVNIGRYNALFAILNNGKTFLINGHYSPNGKYWIERGLSTVEQVENENWGKPQSVEVKGYSNKNRGKTTTIFVSPDEQKIFMAFSKKVNGKKASIYLSERKGDRRYSKPKKINFLGNNKCESMEAPFLTSDGNALYYSCKINGDNNLYMSHRTDDTYRSWSEPIPLNDTINTPGWECYYHLNSKGSWAYFCSNTNSLGKSDIFRVKIFEENPFVRLHGLVLNKADQKLMLADTSYILKVNGSEPEKLKVDRAAASYELLLPFGQSYQLQPEMKNWIGIPELYDATGIKEFTDVELNLYFEPIPYVKIFGKVINTRTNLPISPEIGFKVLINGLENDSVKYIRDISGYQALLPLGQKYVVSLNLPNYRSEADTVDVSNISFYTEKQVDFHVTSAPWVEVYGIAMDNVSFTPIPGSSSPKLLVNGYPADSIAIDPFTGEFTIKLPYGIKHNLAISSKDYNPLDNVVDLTGYVEFTRINHDVYAERKDANMATLYGKVINLKTGQPVESSIPVKLKVNGVETRAFIYDSTTAAYTLKLPVGVSYDILPSVKNFYNKYEQVDLTKTKKGTKVPKNFYITPIEVGQAVNIDFIYFETGKSTLKPQSFRSLNALVDFLNEYPNVIVEIGGHTDNTGSAAINEKISNLRAKAVADYVVSMGIPASRITSKGYSFNKPKASNATATGRAQNRRVEFTIVGI